MLWHAQVLREVGLLLSMCLPALAGPSAVLCGATNRLCTVNLGDEATQALQIPRALLVHSLALQVGLASIICVSPVFTIGRVIQLVNMFVWYRMFELGLSPSQQPHK